MKHWQCYGSPKKYSCNHIEITRYTRNEMKCPVCGGKMDRFYQREDSDSDD